MSSAATNAPGYGDGHIGALVQGVVLCGLLAGAGLLAVTLGSATGDESLDMGYAGHAAPRAGPGPVVIVEPAPLLLVIWVGSEAEAAGLRSAVGEPRHPDGRIADDLSLATAVIASDAGLAAFELAMAAADDVCRWEPGACPRVRVLDLR
jgi:hypothetical protein